MASIEKRDPVLRVGVIGVGWGAAVQVPGFRASRGFEPVALCAKGPERLDPAARRLGIQDTSTDWESFVARDDLDVISVATPALLHGEMVLAALSAGKAVLCEKPLAADLDTARRMAAAASSTSVPTACCFENRWDADLLAVGDLLSRGALGAVYVARVSRSANYWHPTRPLQARWMYDKSQGGGYLAGMLVHDLDFLVSVLGRPVAVCADVRTSEPLRRADGETVEVTADDTATVLLRMESGSTVVASIAAVGLHADHYRLELFGAEGSVTGEGSLRNSVFRAGFVGDAGMTELACSDRSPARPERLPAGLAGHAARAMALMLDDWLPAFEGGASSAPTFADGLLSLTVIDAAQRSSAGAGWVDIDV